MQPWMKSVAAVFAGIFATFVLTTVVDIVLHVVGVLPPLGTPMDDALSVLATAYRLVIGIACAYLTAHLAPHRPVFHALILGVVGTVLGLLGVAFTWGKGLSPTWYPIALAVLALPQCWAGGALWRSRTRSTLSPR